MNWEGIIKSPRSISFFKLPQAFVAMIWVIFEGLNIGAIVHASRAELMVVAMSGNKYNIDIVQFAGCYGGITIWGRAALGMQI